MKLIFLWGVGSFLMYSFFSSGCRVFRGILGEFFVSFILFSIIIETYCCRFFFCWKRVYCLKVFMMFCGVECGLYWKDIRWICFRFRKRFEGVVWFCMVFVIMVLARDLELSGFFIRKRGILSLM